MDTQKEKMELLKKNKELEGQIEAVIKKDTPNKDVLFNYAPNEITVYTVDSEDNLPLQLKSETHKTSNKDEKIGVLEYERTKNGFLESLKRELEGSKKKLYRYVVEWSYVEAEEERIYKKSHFFGEDYEELFRKISGSAKELENVFIHRIEYLPQEGG